MLRVGFKTDKGRVRANNEDALFVLPQQKIYIVADGVGGHLSGEIASRMTVRQIAEYIAENNIETCKDDDSLKHYFLQCLRIVNEEIYKMAAIDCDNAGMATTCVVLYLKGRKAYVINVGDSRAYLIRDKQLIQVTEDHTFVNQLLKSGAISPEEALNHADRNVITRAVGGDPSIQPDFFQFEIYPDDLIVLCTDGLYGELSDDEICSMAYSRKSMHRLAGDYVKAANERGGRDNVTVICVKI